MKRVTNQEFDLSNTKFWNFLVSVNPKLFVSGLQCVLLFEISFGLLLCGSVFHNVSIYIYFFLI